MKKILIAIPTARYIEAETFKCIYDLEVPEGYEVTFQYFYGYRVDQVRNLIADWVVRGFDYLFSVDHDVTFPPDTLKKLLAHDQDLVSGVYRQRLEPQALEIYEPFGNRMSAEDLFAKKWSLISIGGCGFGCVLVKREVLAGVGYPQFVYHPALDHGNTISEDTDFCKKAIEKGFKLWCDPSVLCGHIGSTTMTVQLPPAVKVDSVQQRLRDLSNQRLLPRDHVNFLAKLKERRINPKVIYDIGSCVMHWTNEAKLIWPDSHFYCFEAMDETEFLYKEAGIGSYHGLLTDVDHKKIWFNQNLEHPGGNSYFEENPELSPMATELWKEENRVKKIGMTLDTIVSEKFHNEAWEYPDLIKMDIQGAELDVLKGAQKCLENAEHLILELQHKDYNIGAPKADDVIDYLENLGWINHGMFCGSDLGVDGDYYFSREL